MLLSLVRDKPSDLEPQITTQLSSIRPVKSTCCLGPTAVDRTMEGGYLRSGKACPEGIRKLHDWGAHTAMSSTTGSSLSAHTNGLWVGRKLLTSWWRRKKPKFDSQTGHFYMWSKPKMICCYSTILEVGSKSLPKGRALTGGHAWSFHWSWKRSSSRLDSTWVPSGSVVWSEAWKEKKQKIGVKEVWGRGTW